MPTTAIPRVSAIVVSHNSGADLARCVSDLLAQSVPVEVIVVDNASDDGSLADLLADARLQRIDNPDNRGFAVACNQGAAQARADYLLFVNPDCRLPVDAVERLLKHLQSNPELGLLGARLCDADGRPQAAAERRTPHPAIAIKAALGLRQQLEIVPEPQTADTPLRYVEATSGALMLMPRQLFEALGGFDPGYVLHCEDLDLCRRVLAADRRIAIATDVSITHLKGTSSRHRPIWVEWQKHRGMWRYFRKFDAATSPWWLQVLVAIGIGAHFPLAALRAWWNRGSGLRPRR